ncbi:MAG: L,D-transpeptidase [Anaerolineae bacterium]
MKRTLFSSLILLMLGVSSLPMLVMAQDGDTSSPSAFATNTPSAPLTETSLTAPPDSSEDDDGSATEGEPVVLTYPDACAYVEGQATSADCIDFMETYPEPPVRSIQRDGLTLSQYTFWRVGPQAVNTYADPGGAVNGTIPEGFNFVNVVNQTDGWIQSETGDWISMADGYYVPTSEFVGVMLDEDWQLPFGWILDITGIYASSVPGGEPDSETGLIPLHYERFNIFAEAVDDEGWTWYLVGPDQWVKQIYMTVIQPVDRPEDVSGRWVAVDLFEQSLVAYEDDRPIFATLISTGLPGTETNEGVFEVWARLERDGMSGATGAPNAYALQSVPWVQYFDADISLHGTYWHDTFGYRRSRGCVNLSISDARWMYDFFTPTVQADDPAYVYVYSSDEYRSS